MPQFSPFTSKKYGFIISVQQKDYSWMYISDAHLDGSPEEVWYYDGNTRKKAQVFDHFGSIVLQLLAEGWKVSIESVEVEDDA